IAPPVIPHAASASRTHAPAGSSIVTASTRPRSARTTSTRMELIGAAREGIDHGVGHLVKERLEQLAERPAGEFVAQRECDLACVLDERLETPPCSEFPEP